MKRVHSLFVVLVLSALSIGPAAAEYRRPGTTFRASLAGDGSQSEYPPDILSAAGWENAGPHSPQVSDNGSFVAFHSKATNLAPGDVNLANDVFVRDLANGSTDIVSIASDGSRGIGVCGTNDISHGSTNPSISADGRFVAFQSCFTNLVPGPLPLVPGDTNGVEDVFVHDRKSGVTERVSVSSDGSESNLGSSNPSISASGRYVTFVSSATDLVPDDSNGVLDIFVHDRRTGTTERVSVSSDGAEAEFGPLANPAGCPSISANGRFVAFPSGAHNLVDADTNNSLDVFVHDRKKDETTRVSVASDGSEAGPSAGGSTTCARGERSMAARALSANGRFVVFRSFATNLVPNDSNNNPGYGTDIYVHDLKTRRTERVSVTSSGREIDSESGDAGISADGRYISFASTAPFFADDTGDSPFFLAPGDYDLFVHDRDTGALEWLSVNGDGEQAKHCLPGHTGATFVPSEVDPEASESMDGSISSDGRYVAFTSCADNLVRRDTDGFRDVFVRDRGLAMGAGGSGGSPPEQSSPDDDRICITPDICLPPLGTISVTDASAEAGLAARGADLIEVSIAHRPSHKDLFVIEELEYMPSLHVNAHGVLSTTTSPTLYGLRFEVDKRSYEVRATSLLGGIFGLFDCTAVSNPSCTKIADLEGGYGTTGHRIVFSLPLGDIGLEQGGRLSNVDSYSAIGVYDQPRRIQDRQILDRVVFDGHRAGRDDPR